MTHDVDKPEADNDESKTNANAYASADDVAEVANDVDDDDIGYCNPPKHSRWPKGVSGNPAGRRKKPRDAEGLLKLELEKTITVREGGQEVRKSKLEALILGLVNDSITGKGKARELLLRILNVENPPEPFAPTEADQAALEAFLHKHADS